MITLEEALSIHAILIDKFGGATGIRDRDLLTSALERPYQTFDGKVSIQLQLPKLLH